MTKTVAIIQSNYIPWKGYFDFINRVDEFILYDDVQYTRRDWRNRNRVKTEQGPKWITIPVDVKGKYHQLICETQIADKNWAEAHWKSIYHTYVRAPFFETYGSQVEEWYCAANVADEPYLSNINYALITSICRLLGITTTISWSMNYKTSGKKTERLVGLCEAVGATHYLSGPAAQAYIQSELFDEAGITLEYMDYGGYPQYNQLYPPFEHGVTILDLIFNVGANASEYMLSFDDKDTPSDETLP